MNNTCKVEVHRVRSLPKKAMLAWENMENTMLHANSQNSVRGNGPSQRVPLFIHSIVTRNFAKSPVWNFSYSGFPYVPSMLI